MELDIGYNATQKAIMIWHAIMINKFLFLTKNEKKETVTGMVASVFWAVCEVYRTVWLKWSFCSIFS